MSSSLLEYSDLGFFSRLIWLSTSLPISLENGKECLGQAEEAWYVIDKIESS